MEVEVITVTLACGCSFQSDGEAAPYCAKHGEAQVQSVKAPPPKFVAVGCKVAGPLVTNRG